uniref:RanBP2-type domain-containing protein n=2 Tax=Lotharella globosa TaxID=91324 RepID=A0A7S3YYC3_9EUKA
MRSRAEMELEKALYELYCQPNHLPRSITPTATTTPTTATTTPASSCTTPLDPDSKLPKRMKAKKGNNAAKNDSKNGVNDAETSPTALTSTWSCAVCTFENPRDGGSTCVMCGSESSEAAAAAAEKQSASMKNELEQSNNDRDDGDHGADDQNLTRKKKAAESRTMTTSDTPPTHANRVPNRPAATTTPTVASPPAGVNKLYIDRSRKLVLRLKSSKACRDALLSSKVSYRDAAAGDWGVYGQRKAAKEAVEEQIRSVTLQKDKGTKMEGYQCPNCGGRNCRERTMSLRRDIAKCETWGNKDGASGKRTVECPDCGFSATHEI